MNMKKLIATMLSISVLSTPICALGGANYENSTVTVTEEFSEEAAGERFTLVVYKPDHTEDTIKQVQYMSETTANEKGILTFSYTQTSESGEYNYVVTGESGMHRKSGILYFTNIGAYNEVMKQLGEILDGETENKAEQLQTLLSKNVKTLQLAREFPIYYEIAKGQTLSAYKRMEKTLKKNMKQEQIIETFQSAMLLCGLENPTMTPTILNTYSEKMGIDSKMVKFYEVLKNKEAVATQIGGKRYETKSDMQDAYYKIVGIAALNDSGISPNWISLGTTIDDVKKNAKLDTSALDSYTGTKHNQILQELVGKRPFTDAVDFKEKLDNAIASLPSPGGGGVSGGVSGGGVSSSIKTDVILQPEMPKPVFSDLDSVPWAKDAILGLAQLGVVQGSGNGIFEPNEIVTREAFLKMLLLGLKLEQKTAEVSFADVVQDEWYALYIQSAVAYEIVEGNGEGNFGIEQPITRQDAAVMLQRGLKAANKTIMKERANVFADDTEIATYAKDAVYALAAQGILNGVGENQFAPLQAVTRAQAAKMIFGLRG